MRPLVVLVACVATALFIPGGNAALANAECWAYYVEFFDADGELEGSNYGSYCWTSNPSIWVWQFTPASQEQYEALGAAHAAGVPGITHGQFQQPLEGGGHYILDGYQVYQEI